MVQVTTEALVLRSYPAGEADLVVHLYTASLGKLTALAKGAKRSVRRFMNCLDDFGLLWAVLDHKAERELMRLDSCRFLGRPEVQADVVRFGLAGLAAELTLLFCPERQPDPAIYQALRTTLLSLPHSPDPASLGLAFALRLLHASGFGPVLERCLSCGRSLEEVRGGSLEPARGGLVCAACAPRGSHLSRGGLKAARRCQVINPLALDRVRFPVQDLTGLFKAASVYLTMTAEREIKSLAFLDQVGFTLG